MLNIKEKAERYKNKKELLKELNLYKSMILKKFQEQFYKSALEKAKSAIVLLEEYQEDFDLKVELMEFKDLNQQITDELNRHKKTFLRRYEYLLKEELSESNLVSFLKLLAMLKEDVDKNLDKYNLYELRDNITTYFKYIKKLYVILSSYEVLNFKDASTKIFTYGSEIKNKNFPNLESLIVTLYQKLLINQLIDLSKQYKRLTLRKISEILVIKPEHLLTFIKLITKQSNSPIESYNPKTQILVLKD